MTLSNEFIVRQDCDAAYQFIHNKIPMYRSEWMTGIVLERRGEIVAATLFMDWNKTNIFMHSAGTPGTNWLTREYIYWCFNYPFKQLNCSRVTCSVDEDNIASNRFVKKLGFRLEAVLSRASKTGKDVNIYCMFKEDCKYG